MLANEPIQVDISLPPEMKVTKNTGLAAVSGRLSPSFFKNSGKILAPELTKLLRSI